jgi:hypothetical protein
MDFEDCPLSLVVDIIIAGDAIMTLKDISAVLPS